MASLQQPSPQPGLFQTETFPYQPTSPTSRAAAESVEPATAAAHRRRVLEYVSNRHDGATREEIELATGLSGNTVRPRVVELIHAGSLRESNVTRKTRSGRNAAVLLRVA